MKLKNELKNYLQNKLEKFFNKNKNYTLSIKRVVLDFFSIIYLFCISCKLLNNNRVCTVYTWCEYLFSLKK